jgi:phosphoribosylaminoimidazole-succinocarboxamide synthase
MKTNIDVKSLKAGKQLYEGKAKKVFEALDAAGKPLADVVIIHYKDDATAGDGAKKGTIADKGLVNNKMSAILFELLEKQGVPTHYLGLLNERDMVCAKVKIVPLEVIIRNVAAGSMAKRLGLQEGYQLKTTVFELSYKSDALHDPLINKYHALGIGACSEEQYNAIEKLAFKVNSVLKDFFIKRGVKLIDFKLEFGVTNDGKLVLADEISPDTCRFWDAKTNEKLDKDRFRRDLGDAAYIQDAYTEMLKRVEA